MAQLDSNKTSKNLQKKGFELNDTDHHRLEYYHKGKFVLHTKVSHGGKHDLDNFLISQMAKQCKLSKNDFLDLARCPLSKEAYLKKLNEQGLLDE
jgi:7-keto-8-aminopelargonate synthetase-like enzyme